MFLIAGLLDDGCFRVMNYNITTKGTVLVFTVENFLQKLEETGKQCWFSIDTEKAMLTALF